MNKIFDNKLLEQCAKKAVGSEGQAMFDTVINALVEAYPRYIDPENRTWLLNYAGGCKWNMCLLYASLSEYVMIVGSSVGTAGFSGRYRVNITDFIFAGEVLYNQEGETERKVYKAGDVSTLEAGQAALINIPNSAWMIEYAHGFIPSMIPFGLIETLTSTLDWRACYRTSKVYFKQAVKSYRTNKEAKQKITSV